MKLKSLEATNSEIYANLSEVRDEIVTMLKPMVVRMQIDADNYISFRELKLNCTDDLIRARAYIAKTAKDVAIPGLKDWRDAFDAGALMAEITSKLLFALRTGRYSHITTVSILNELPAFAKKFKKLQEARLQLADELSEEYPDVTIR